MQKLVIFTLLSIATAAKLPSYLKVCKRTDPNINECFRDAVQDALPKIRDGMPELNFAAIEPFEISNMAIDAGGNAVKVVQNYKNLKIYELSNSIVDSAKLEHGENDFHGELDVTIPIIRAEGEYSVEGQLLMLPISGNGKCKIIFKDSKSVIKMVGNKMEKKGKIYLEITSLKVTFEPKGADFHFDNLFNGDAQLGDAMNTLINENWLELFEEIKPGFEEVFSQLFKNTANSIFTKVAAEDMFPK